VQGLDLGGPLVDLALAFVQGLLALVQALDALVQVFPALLQAVFFPFQLAPAALDQLAGLPLNFQCTALGLVFDLEGARFGLGDQAGDFFLGRLPPPVGAAGGVVPHRRSPDDQAHDCGHDHGEHIHAVYS